MLEFSEGWTWFAAGLGTMPLMSPFVVAVVAFARRRCSARAGGSGA